MIEFFEMITRNKDMSVKVNSHSYPYFCFTNKNLKYIGKSAFECCIFLKKVKWNKKLKRIEEYAFANTDVRKKKFSKKTKVEKYAFWNG